MIKRANPASVHQPLGAYVHTMRVSKDADWLVISGQVGAHPDGTFAVGARAQAEQALRNIVSCLADGGMAPDDLVKMTVYLTDARFVADFRNARSAILGDEVMFTSTLVIVAGLAGPDLLVEVEAWAARA